MYLLIFTRYEKNKVFCDSDKRHLGPFLLHGVADLPSSSWTFGNYLRL